MMKNVLSVILGFAVALLAYGEAIRVTDNVAELVLPVLSAQAQVALHDTVENAEALDRALSPILRKRTQQTTEALAILLGFYIGERSGEDVACELVSRGQEAKIFLEKYAQSEISLPGAKQDDLKLVKSEYPIVLQRIQAHEHCEREQ